MPSFHPLQLAPLPRSLWLAGAVLAAGCQTQPLQSDDVPPPPLMTQAASVQAQPETQVVEEAPVLPPVEEVLADASGDALNAVLLLGPSLPVGDTPEVSLDWPGTYQAIFPCNGCRGVAISVQLREDKTAVVRERRIGEPHDGTITPSYTGPFYFSDSHPHLIALTEPGLSLPAYQFAVGEHWIELRDRHTGSRLTMHDNWRLKKTSSTD